MWMNLQSTVLHPRFVRCSQHKLPSDLRYNHLPLELYLPQFGGVWIPPHVLSSENRNENESGNGTSKEEEISSVSFQPDALGLPGSPLVGLVRDHGGPRPDADVHPCVARVKGTENDHVSVFPGALPGLDRTEPASWGGSPRRPIPGARTPRSR